MDNLYVFDHVLIDHKVAKLRDVNTSTKEFREIVEEIAMLMAFEALKDAPTQKKMVTTPLMVVEQNVLAEDSIAILPILRAGLGMVNGVLALVPTAKVGHIGMYRDEETLQPKEYYCKVPKGIQDKTVILLDTMLATGGSANMAIKYLKDIGVKKIKLMSVLGAPEGVKAVMEMNPDIQLYLAKLDKGLNENGYILPGLGDAGDRIFGTK